MNNKKTGVKLFFIDASGANISLAVIGADRKRRRTPPQATLRRKSLVDKARILIRLAHNAKMEKNKGICGVKNYVGVNF